MLYNVHCKGGWDAGSAKASSPPCAAFRAGWRAHQGHRLLYNRLCNSRFLLISFNPTLISISEDRMSSSLHIHHIITAIRVN